MVKIQSDPRTFAVEPGNYTIRHVADEATAIALFGSTWNKRIIDVEPTYFSRFTIGSVLSGTLHPAGSVLKDGSTTYYFDGSTKRAFASDAARKANFFQDKYVISGVTASDWKTKADGAAITGFEDALFSLQS